MSLIHLAIILLVGSFVISAGLTFAVKRVATRIGFVARPTEDRYHRSVVALGGGVAIVATIITILIAGILVVRLIVAPGKLTSMGQSVTVHTTGFLEKTGQLIIVMACIGVLFITGLIDDRKRLGPFVKLAIQTAVAIAAAAFADVRVELFIQSKLVTSLLSAFWIVLIINAFNFLDNMDGASAGIAVIVSAILFTAAAMSGQVFIGAMALLLIGTLLGFLIFNFPPAKIFMGDAGSLPMGFIVALLTLRTTYYHESAEGAWYAVLIPLISMAVPLYDFLSVTFLRISQGTSPLVGDTQHFSHRLRKRGLSDTQTALTLYLATLCTGVGAIILYQVRPAGAVLIFIQTIMILAIIAILETQSSADKHSDERQENKK
ncbi:MAG: undecaprenyl/decaprenyl-phosphate alpha-N-acetylglucosaminyl 1-phosphate transferase [Sedimentisphaerales bacterium]|nr:undecaprenyl/decaprenyl-phosphate alpha-N-acetylglucosaminyl 1-phosphate transferase [Sedimentisphaerales bacterium]